MKNGKPHTENIYNYMCKSGDTFGDLVITPKADCHQVWKDVIEKGLEESKDTFFTHLEENAAHDLVMVGVQ